jgi:molybdenum cofactor cytidylyltransferase
MTSADKHGAFAGVVLAAGRSRRAGAFKPALVLADKPLLIHAVDGLQPWCSQVIVVVGHDGARTSDLLVSRPEVTVVVNSRYDEGMFVSVQTGVRAVDPACDGFFILPVDCPLVSAEVFTTLGAAFQAHGSGRPLIPTHADRGGHPALAPIAVRDAILEAAPTATLRQVLAGAGALRVPVASPSVLTDLDTPADLEKLRAALRRRGSPGS